MASENENQPQPRRRPRLLPALAIAALLPVMLGIWLLATESGARAAFAMIDSLSAGMVRAAGIHGRVSGPLRIEQLTLALPGNRIALQELRLDWAPSALLRQRLHLSSLQVGQLDIASSIDSTPEPARLPQGIALPLALHIDEARIDGGAFHRGPVKLLSLGRLAFDLDFDGRRYRLGLRELAVGSALEKGSVASRVSGQATLSVLAPYALQGHFSSSANVVLDRRALGASGSIGLSGTLAELAVQLDLVADQAPLKGNLILKPFSEQPLGAAQLSTRRLDLARLDASLPRTALDIDFTAQENGAGDLVMRNSAAGPYNEGKLPLSALRLSFRQSAGQFHAERISALFGSGSIVASAALGLSGNQTFRAQGRISRLRLQELGNFPGLPRLDLNAAFSLQGARQPQLDAELAFSIEDSRLAGQPLAGAGRAQLRGEQLIVPDFLLASGANRLKIEGRLSQGDAKLVFALNAPQLAQLGSGFGGALRANGTVHGTLKRPRIGAEWSAANLRAPGPLEIAAMQGKAELAIDRGRAFILDTAVADVTARGLRYGADRLASLAMQGRFAPQPDAPLVLNLRAEGIAAGQLRAQGFSAVANGTTARHVIEASLNEAGQDWRLTARGGFSRLAGAARWQGDIARFNAAGRINAQLASSAALLISAQQMQLDHFLLDSDSGRVSVERFARNADGIATQGKLERMQLAQLLRLARPDAPLRTDLLFSGEWDVRIADTVSGTLGMRRDQGDVTVLGGTPVTLGLRRLNASAGAQAGRLALQLQAEGRQLGVIDLNAGTQAGSGSTRLTIAPDAPLTGRARIEMPSLAWIAPLLSPSLAADGRLQGDVTLGGSVGQPRLAGRISGDGLRIAMADLGIDLRQGSLQSEFQGERLMIGNLSFQGEQGRIAIAGPVDLGANPAAQLTLHAERFALLNRTDRRVLVSGDSRFDLREQHAKISGAFTVDAGFFDLGSADKPQLSDDVVIVGREKKAPQQLAAAIDLRIGLGDGVTLKGRGLNALLAGNIRIVSKEGEAPQAVGTLNVAKGTFSAYGRELAIEQGLLRFTGSLANPALDILAMRRGQEVEAGVSVRGAVLAPRITLVSEPAVPDAEKLSWLVLGRSLGSAGQGDAGTLQAAAAALLSDSAKAGVQSRIASAFGLDTFSVGTSQDSLQQRIVTLGKQVSSRLYLSYRQGLDAADSAVQLRYALSPKLSVEAEAGTRSALSLFYNITFD